MKIKTLVAVLLLSGGVTSTFAQTENCNSNSSISHEAVRAGNFKDAYAPCMAVLKDCPTLRYYTFTDAQKILVGFLSQIKDRNSADYKKYFDELMDVYDLRMKYIPEFINKGMKGVPSVADALGAKAVDYLQFAPTPGHDLSNDAYEVTQTGDSNTGATSATRDTIVTCGIPTTFGAGVTYVYDNRLTVGADVMFQNLCNAVA